MDGKKHTRFLNAELEGNTIEQKLKFLVESHPGKIVFINLSLKDLKMKPRINSVFIFSKNLTRSF